MLALDHLRRGDSLGIKTFKGLDGRQVSTSTKADIFEVKNGVGCLYPGLDDDALRASLRDDAPGTRSGRRLRIIFLDGDESEAERLPITSESLKFVHDTYDIAPRFSFYLSRQQMAGSSMHFDSDNKPGRLQWWYSAVLRTMTAHNPTETDNSRRVLNWMRCCVWADYDAATGDSTVFAWRFPVHMKQAFLDEFSGPKGAVLETHPMLLHASWTERLCTHTRDINLWFFEPLYGVENHLSHMKSPADLFETTRNLTKVYRQIRQVLSDYEVS